MSDLRKLLDEAAPAPWDAALETGCHGVVASINGEAKFVALIGNDNDTPEREPLRFANARLIALAPDLAAALLKAEDALAMLVDRDISYDGPKLCIPCQSHSHAIGAASKARATLTEIRKITGAK